MRGQGRGTRIAILCGLVALLSSLVPPRVWAAGETAAQAYNPSWADELNWANQPLWAKPTGASAWLEDLYKPWWQGRVASPVTDYSPSKLATGAVRLDTALDSELTLHRPLPGWGVQTSPTGINNVYTFTPGSSSQQDRTARAGQNAYFNLGAHPIENLTAAIGAELVGNYDQRYWFPVNDEHRMFKDDVHAKIVTGEVKYDTKPFMIRAFEGVPVYGWTAQNDLFQLLPPQVDTSYYRDLSGTLTPRGGEMRVSSPLGTLTALGGTEIRWGYGSSGFAKYDAPNFGNLEQSVVYRNENIPWGLENPDERRWALSYNASYLYSDRVQYHAGVLYQPFRIGTPYQTANSTSLTDVKTTERKDAFGATARSEIHPTQGLDLIGLGYTYEGRVAGNKHEVDVDGSRTFSNWMVSAAYIYRQPVEDPVPTTFQGTLANPGAFLTIPRGPDDPFRVDWDNRKAHIGSLTLVFNPTPGTPFFKYQRNVIEDWNINPDLESTWVGALQYRVTHYLSNTDRLYYWDENRTLIYDPVSFTNSGARATDHPFSSATGLLRYRQDKWRATADLSGGEALAGAGIAYTSATNFYKPSTIYVSGGLSVQYDFLKAFVRYGQDVWGPIDYQTQLGWTYHKIYQAGLSADFLKSFEAGFRYIATRMTNDFIGSDTGAFNEYRFYLTYHFTLEKNFEQKFKAVGRPLPQAFPESKITLSGAEFTPDGSGPNRVVTLFPQAYAQSGILTWKLTIRNAQGETVQKWEGNGVPPKAKEWEGVGLDAKPLPAGTYSVILNVVDLYGNEATSPAQAVEIHSAAPTPSVPPAAKPYTLQTTPEGLRVTLSSLVLFDVNKYDLRASAKEGLDQVIELLRAYPTNALRISGHTDASGGAAHNQALSEKRAQAVANYLMQKGNINAARVKTVGYGKRRPVASNATEEGRQQNRRVEIDILK
jgi:outer membrane protein OmpA-like peptidoglycan-associated protein